MKLFAIVKTEDSCQPEQGIEPSFTSTVTKDDLDQGQEIQEDTVTPVDVEENQSTKSVANTSEREQKKDLFVSTKKITTTWQ